MEPEAAKQIEMYRRMAVIRDFELSSMDLFQRGPIKGAVHPSIGQDSSGVAVAWRSISPI